MQKYQKFGLKKIGGDCSRSNPRPPQLSWGVCTNGVTPGVCTNGVTPSTPPKCDRTKEGPTHTVTKAILYLMQALLFESVIILYASLIYKNTRKVWSLYHQNVTKFNRVCLLLPKKPFWISYHNQMKIDSDLVLTIANVHGHQTLWLQYPFLQRGKMIIFNQEM